MNVQCDTCKTLNPCRCGKIPDVESEYRVLDGKSNIKIQCPACGESMVFNDMYHSMAFAVKKWNDAHPSKTEHEELLSAIERIDNTVYPPIPPLARGGFMRTRIDPFEIERVIFNNPATIVFWKDGAKTVVKAVDEPFDEEKGLAMAIVKKVYGNKGNYFNKIKKWVWPKMEKLDKLTHHSVKDGIAKPLASKEDN